MTTVRYHDHDFTLVSKNRFTSFFYNEDLKMAVCSADEEYIPIDTFKEIFMDISRFIEKKEITHLVFDKQKLRTFHQPSMEWYFAVWKPAIKSKGLINHYKILPQLDWFKKAVEAGKHELFQKFSKEILNGITITYVNSVEEAIKDSVLMH